MTLIDFLLAVMIGLSSPVDAPNVLQSSSQDTFYASATAKARGEASFAVPEILCTMRNRIGAGWAQERVLEAYYAPDVWGNDALWMAQVEMAREIFEGGWPCDPRLYYALGTHDTWLPHDDNPVLVVYRDMGRPDRGHVRFYAR